MFQTDVGIGEKAETPVPCVIHPSSVEPFEMKSMPLMQKLEEMMKEITRAKTTR